ncbi:hypothetical protein [Baaleninema sp.]|uniref:hypothetical protein n=1 Tax=Baaleninema sp. TaxID=3101197 RepID=UPI003D01A17B
MSHTRCIFCFRAESVRSNFDENQLPDWLEVRANWQGYRVATQPWVADVAREIGLLLADDTPDDWIRHLESLGLQEIRQISCQDYYEDTLYW